MRHIFRVSLPMRSLHPLEKKRKSVSSKEKITTFLFCLYPLKAREGSQQDPWGLLRRDKSCPFSFLFQGSPSRVFWRDTLSFLFVSFRFFSFLFHTLKRTLIKRNEKGGSAQDTTSKSFCFFSFPLKEKGPFRREKEKSCPFSFFLRVFDFEETLFRFFSFLFHTLKRTLIKRNEKGGSAQDTNKRWKIRDGKQGMENKGYELPLFVSFPRVFDFEETFFRFFSKGRDSPPHGFLRVVALKVPRRPVRGDTKSIG